MPGLAAIILAAGGSTRMGRPKQLLELGGRTLLSRSVDLAEAAGCGPIVVVIGANVDAMREELRSRTVSIAENPNWASGIGTSIRTGVAALLDLQPHADRLVILLCDQPSISAETIGRLEAHQRHTGRQICASSYAGTIGPPVLVSGSFIQKLLSIPDQSGAKALWLDHPDSLGVVPSPEGKADIDTPADFAKCLSSSAYSESPSGASSS